MLAGIDESVTVLTGIRLGFNLVYKITVLIVEAKVGVSIFLEWV